MTFCLIINDVQVQTLPSSSSNLQAGHLLPSQWEVRQTRYFKKDSGCVCGLLTSALVSWEDQGSAVLWSPIAGWTNCAVCYLPSSRVIPTHCSAERLICAPDVIEELCHQAVHSTVYFQQCWAAQMGHSTGAATLFRELELCTVWHKRGWWSSCPRHGWVQ